MNIYEEISTKLQQGRSKEVKALVEQALEQGHTPKDLLNEALIKGMSVIGEKFKHNLVYVPEVLIAARAMNGALEILRPVLASTGVKPMGKALICTVEGDLHDIGKNLVKMMLEGQGIECVDLGVDVHANQVVEAVIEHQPDLVCLSALLTTTMSGQKDTIIALVKAGVRSQVKILIGGAPVTARYAEEIGADGYAQDAASASELARNLLVEKRA